MGISMLSVNYLAMCSGFMPWQHKGNQVQRSFKCAFLFFCEVLYSTMQVSPTCDVKEVPGQDRWKFLHIFQLIRVRTKFPCNGIFDCKFTLSLFEGRRKEVTSLSVASFNTNLELRANKALYKWAVCSLLMKVLKLRFVIISSWLKTLYTEKRRVTILLCN